MKAIQILLPDEVWLETETTTFSWKKQIKKSDPNCVGLYFFNKAIVVKDKQMQLLEKKKSHLLLIIHNKENLFKPVLSNMLHNSPNIRVLCTL